MAPVAAASSVASSGRRRPSSLAMAGVVLFCLGAALALVAAAAAEGQCPAGGSDPDCQGATSGAQLAAASTGGAAAAGAGGGLGGVPLGHLQEEGSEAEEAEEAEEGGGADLEGGGSADGRPNRSRKGKGKRPPPEISYWAVGLLFSLFGFVLLWIGATIKFAIDGSLPARLALWGFMPEAYAAISVRSVVALLRLKQGPTPIVVLRNCLTDANAHELANAIRTYGPKADLQALELKHNPQLSAKGVETLVAAALEEASTLEEMDLSYNPQLGGAVVAALRPLLRTKASKVNALKLADCNLKVADIEKLAEDLEKSCLRTLDLSWNPLGSGKGGEALASALEAPVLEELIAAKCGLSIEDTKAIAEQLPYTSLKSLQLGGNEIGAEGLRELAAVLPKCQIEELGLEAIGIQASDLDVLAAAWAKRPFSRVRLMGNMMTNEEIGAFVKALKTMHA